MVNTDCTEDFLGEHIGRIKGNSIIETSILP